MYFEYFLPIHQVGTKWLSFILPKKDIPKKNGMLWFGESPLSELVHAFILYVVLKLAYALWINL